MQSFSVLIGGRAGDGINEAGTLIARVLNQLGYRIYIYYDYPSLIRGGHNFSIVRACDRPIGSHTDRVDMVIALNQETVTIHSWRLNENGVMIYDSDQVKASGVAIPVGKIMKAVAAPPVMRNTCMVGAFARACGVDWTLLKTVIEKRFSKLIELNLTVAQHGYSASEERMRLQALPQAPRPVLTGNEAIGLGLLAGGLGAYISYPMTPSSGILHFMAHIADQFGISVIHPENEIAVILMAIGFAYAGVKSAVGTSGGGFCLMTEGLSLAAQSETPIVLVVSQRPGPSTGVPTYTAQGDLGFAINAGHGEFLRLVVAPGDAQQAFCCSTHAMNLAWRYQIPAIILADKTLSEGSYSFDSLPHRYIAADGGQWDGIKPYRRYEHSQEGVSPIAFPGTVGVVVKSNSYMHDQAGISTEEPEEIAAFSEKMCSKWKSLSNELESYRTVVTYGNPYSKTALICWGSNKGPCKEAAESLSLKAVQPLVLWPFPSMRIVEALQGVEQTICVENNRLGQLARLMRSEGFSVDETILKFDGRPFSKEDLLLRIGGVI